MNNNVKRFYTFSLIFVQFILYYVIFIRNNIIQFDSFSSQLMCLFTIINSYYFTRKIDDFKKQNYFSKWYYILLYIILNLIISFIISGKQLFLSSPNVPITLSFHSLIIFLFTNLYVFPFIYNLTVFFDKVEIKLNFKRKKSNLFVWISTFLFIFIIWSIISLGFFPANMTSDSVDQWLQALGYSPIHDSHPPFLAIIMRLLSYIWKNPFIIILFNICFFAIVFSFIMAYLYKRGVPLKYIFIIVILFTLSVNNMSLVGIVWKDIPFTASFMWLTYEIFKIYDQKDKYFKNVYNIISIIFAMLFINLLRANGLIQLLTVITILLFLFLKYKDKFVKVNILIIIFSTFGINFFITHVIYDLVDVHHSSGGTPSTYMFMARGVGAVAHYSDNISYKSLETMKKMMNFEDLKNNYNPYNGDTYAFGDKSWKDTLPKIVPKEMYLTFFRECYQHPNIIIRDRLDSNNLLWSITTPNDGFNSTYVTGIWFPDSVNPKIINLNYTDKNQKVYFNKKNIINDTFSKYRNYFENNTILYIIFWRPAFAVSILLILCYILILKKSNLLMVALPTITGILFWVLFMVHQSYRYLWFIYINLILLSIFYIYENSKKKMVKNDK